MFLLDDIAMAPMKGLFFIVKEVANACQQHIDAERAELMNRLTALHREFEQGAMDEETFETREQEILDRLEQFED